MFFTLCVTGVLWLVRAKLRGTAYGPLTEESKQQLLQVGGGSGGGSGSGSGSGRDTVVVRVLLLVVVLGS